MFPFVYGVGVFFFLFALLSALSFIFDGQPMPATELHDLIVFSFGVGYGVWFKGD